MIKLITKIALLLIGLSSQLLSSQTLTGTIVDNESMPIPYASISIAKKGMLSNDEGVFSFDKKKFKPTDSIKISYLGYEQIKLIVKEFKSQTYTLQEKVNELSKVFISNKKLSIDDILLKITENLSDNYSNSFTKQQIFNRNSYSNTFKRFDFKFTKSTLLNKKQLKKANKSIDSIIKKNLSKTSTNFSEKLCELYIAKDSTKIKVIKSINLINKDEDLSQEALQKIFLTSVVGQLDKNATYKVKSGIFPVEDSLKIDVDFKNEMYKDSVKSYYTKRSLNGLINMYGFNKKSELDFVTEQKKYNYELKGITEYDDEMVYIIDFKPKKSSAKFKGTMYVNGYDFAIVKVDFKYGENRHGQSGNFKFLFGVKFREHTWNASVLYKKNSLDKYQLKFISQKRGSYAYIERPFKFKKNRASKAEAKKLIKLEILMEINGYSKTELFFIADEEITKKRFDSYSDDKKHKINYISKYNTGIWKNYNVLSPVNEIKNYNTGKHN